MSWAWQRLSARGRGVLDHAGAEAIRLGNTFIGVEHLLLGIVRDERGALALTGLGADVEGIRERVEGLLRNVAAGETDQERRSDGLPMNPLAIILVTAAAHEAELLGHAVSGPEHFLLGILRYGRSVAGDVLAAAGGGDLDAVRRRVLELAADRATL